MFSVSLGHSFKISFLALVNQKPLVIKNYAILNKRNVPVRLTTTLEDPASTGFL